MLRTAVVACRMLDSHVFDSEAGNEGKVAAPEADEWAGKGRDVAFGASQVSTNRSPIHIPGGS